MTDTPQPVARPVHPGEMERSISIREFEQRIASLEQAHSVQVSHVKEIALARAEALEKALNLQADMNQKALTLQAAEYERRLGELNGAHEEARKNWAMSLPREIFSQFEKSQLAWKAEIDQKVALQLRQTADHEGDLTALKVDVNGLKAKGDQVSGGLNLAKAMGAAGLIAFGISILRIAGVVK